MVRGKNILCVATLVTCIYTPMCTVLRVACVYVAIKSFSIFEQRAVHFLLSHVYRIVNIDVMYRVGAHAGRL
jgi:hypothetical protein